MPDAQRKPQDDSRNWHGVDLAGDQPDVAAQARFDQWRQARDAAYAAPSDREDRPDSDATQGAEVCGRPGEAGALCGELRPCTEHGWKAYLGHIRSEEH